MIVFQYEVGSEVPGSGLILQRNHRDIGDRGMLAQTGFDFARFDAVATHFDHGIGASQVLNDTVSAVTGQITGAVDAFT
jgi:hypothetical protein